MSIRRRLNTYSTRVTVLGWPQRIMIGLAFLAAPVATFAQNPNCTLIVPNNPLTAHGLATPYQLVATKPADGPCHEATKVQAAFVQAAVIDLTTGHISIYNPLVIDAGTTPAVAPVVPQLPLFNVVALWFGYNGDDLTLVGANPSVLAANDCHQDMGQFAYCNAPAFFASAGFELLINNLSIPPLGTGHDGRPCPSVRSFAAVDHHEIREFFVNLGQSGGLAMEENGRIAPGIQQRARPALGLIHLDCQSLFHGIELRGFP